LEDDHLEAAHCRVAMDRVEDWRAEMGKYHNKKTEIDGYVFDSQAEARRYQELALLKKAGEIHHLQIHPKYKLVVNDKLICTYSADFRYCDSLGYWIVEDVKGVKTAVYQLKKKLMFALHHIVIVEVAA
jgi:hypothetical protein